MRVNLWRRWLRQLNLAFSRKFGIVRRGRRRRLQTVRPSAARALARQADNAFVPTFDRLEERLLLAAPVLEISGASSVGEGSLYTLNLSATDADAEGVTIESWFINWGDGSDPDGDGDVGEIVLGNPESVTHIYADGPANYTIRATATDLDDTYTAGAIGVNARASLDVGFSDDGEDILNRDGQTADYGRGFTLDLPDGKILVVGYTTGGGNDIALVQYNADGTLDTSFGDGGRVITDFGGSEQANSVVRLTNGQLLVGTNRGLVRYDADGTLDTAFGNNGLLNTFTNIQQLQQDSAGRIVALGGSNLARFFEDGTFDLTFSGDGTHNLGYSATDFTFDEDGKILTVSTRSQSGGPVTLYDLVVRRHNVDGSLDTTFGTGGLFVYNTSSDDNPDFRDQAQSIAAQNGKILVGGYTEDYRLNEVTGDYQVFTRSALLLRLDLNGALDDSFGDSGVTLFRYSGMFQILNEITPDDDGGILLRDSSYIYRLDADGNLDITFGDSFGRTYSGLSSIYSFGIGADGDIYVVGYIGGGVTGNDFSVQRLTSDGLDDSDFQNSIRTGFEGSLSDYYREVIVDPVTGSVLVIGYSSGANSDIILSRYLADGSLDLTFGTDGLTVTDFNSGSETPTAAAVAEDGRIYVAYSGYVVRYSPDGVLDTSWGTGGRLSTTLSDIQALSFADDGDLLIGGSRYQNLGEGLPWGYDFAVARYDSSGTIETSFGTNGTATVDIGTTETVSGYQFINGMDVDSDGSIVFAGRTYSANVSGGSSFDYAAVMGRLDSTGQLVTSFGGNGTGLLVTTGSYESDYFRDLVIDSEGRVLVAAGSHIHRYLADGTLDTSFNGTGIVSGSVQSLAIDSDGKIIGGSDSTLRRWNDDGTPDTTFGPSGQSSISNRSILGVDVTADDRVIAVGYAYATGPTGNDAWIGRFSNEGLLVQVNNLSPSTPSVTGPTTANEGDTISLSASATDPAGDNDPLTYNWTIYRDWTVYTQLSGKDISFVAPDNGTYQAYVAANDGDGGSSGGYHNISVTNVAPTATLNLPAESVTEGEQFTVLLTAAADSSTVDQTADFTYSFNFGQGWTTYSSSNTASFTAVDGGIVSVLARVRDKDGGFTEYSGNVTIDNIDPTIDADETGATVIEGQTATNSGSFADTAGGPLALAASIGTVVDNGDGTWNWSFTSSDGPTQSQAVTITVTDANDAESTVTFDLVVNNVAPTVGSNSLTVQEGSTGTALGLSAPTDPGSDTLTITVTALPDAGTVTLANGTAVLSGQILTAAELTGLRYDAPADYDGEPVSDFKYEVDDGTTQVEGTVALTVTRPLATDDEANTNEDSTVTGNLVANDTDPENDPLVVIAINGDEVTEDEPVTLPSGATFTVQSDGSYLYDPRGAFDALKDGAVTTDTFTYTISDGNGGSDTATVRMTVTGVNDAPTAVADTPITSEETVVTGNVLTNDTDPDTDATLTVGTINGEASDVGSEITLPSGAKLTVNADGTYSYDPNGVFNNLAAGANTTDSFTYTALDEHAATSDSVTVAITITGVNDAPTAAADTPITSEETVVTGNVLTNDTDPDTSDTLTVSAVNGEAADVDTEITLSSGALLTVHADGTYTYDPNGAFNGLADGATATDSFEYTIDDGNGGSNTATVTITITGLNDGPTAQGDSATTDELSTTTGNLLTNDSDPNGDPLTVTHVNGQAVTNGQTVTLASGARLTIQTNGSYVYDSNGAFNHLSESQTATDTFTYTISDGLGGTATATATMTVTGLDTRGNVTINPKAIAAGKSNVKLNFTGGEPVDLQIVFTDAGVQLIGQNGTTINGLAMLTLDGADSLRGKFGDGNDKITVVGDATKARIDLGGGNNTVVFDDFTSSKQTSVSSKGGSLDFSAIDSTFGKLLISGGNLDDTLTFLNVRVDNTTTLRLLDGMDNITIHDSTFGGNFSVSSSGDEAAFNVETGAANGAMTQFLGKFRYATGANPAILLGPDADDDGVTFGKQAGFSAKQPGGTLTAGNHTSFARGPNLKNISTL